MGNNARKTEYRYIGKAFRKVDGLSKATGATAFSESPRPASSEASRKLPWPLFR